VAAYTFRTIDAELAQLTFDSLAEGASAVRGADGPRVLTFSTAAAEIEVEISDGRLVGQLMPARAATVEIRGRDRTITVTADALGRFAAGPLSPGALSLRCHLDRTIVTEWISFR
jgi:hypothetical protein